VRVRFLRYPSLTIGFSAKLDAHPTSEFDKIKSGTPSENELTQTLSARANSTRISIANLNLNS